VTSPTGRATGSRPDTPAQAGPADQPNQPDQPDGPAVGGANGSQRTGWGRRWPLAGGRRGSVSDPPARSLAELLTAAGAPLPAATRPAPPARAGGGARPPVAPPQGRHGPGRGRAASAPDAVTWQADSSQLAGLYPFVFAPGVPPRGAPIGFDAGSGGVFCAHPVEWLRAGLVTNPNMFWLGAPGRGKSMGVKILCWRLLPFGARILIPGDTKDEYAPMCQALGVQPIRLGPGLPGRLNPLDAGPLGRDLPRQAGLLTERLAAIRSRRLLLAKALLGARGYRMSDTDELAFGAAVDQLSGQAGGNTALVDMTIPQVWAALRTPTAAVLEAASARNQREFTELTRSMTAALNVLVKGSLAGIFDAPSTVHVDFTAPIQSVSLRALEQRGEEAVGCALACVNSWATAEVDRDLPGVQIVLRDEMWRALRLGPEMVRKADADLRLSRSENKIQIMVAHKPSDLASVGDAGSQATAIAKDFMALCSTKVVFGLDAAPAAELSDAIGLSGAETRRITSWPENVKGRAVWKVGARSFVVQTNPTGTERVLFDTNDAILPSGPAGR